MSTQHTPGPWAARQEFANRWRIEQIPEAGIVPLSVGLACTTILEVGVSNHNTAANAQLMAAAPDHHAVALALDDLMLVIESAVRHADPANHPLVMQLITANRAAIRKATGAA